MSSLAIETKITWCDSTCNGEMGCDGCELWTGGLLRRSCYAGKLTVRKAGQSGWPTAFDVPKIFPDRIPQAARWPDLTGKVRPEKPWLNGLPRLIFLNDMGDTFTESLPIDWLAPYLPVMEKSSHIWLVLTKRPRRMAEFFAEHAVPGRVWLGTSVTDQRTARARIPELVKIQTARVRFLSVEPLLGPVDLAPNEDYADMLWLDWVIVGGESGENFRPMKPEWARAIRDQCSAADVSFFFKQSSGRFPDSEPTLDGREWRQMPGNKGPCASCGLFHGPEMELNPMHPFVPTEAR